MHSSCLSPTEKFSPFSSTSACSLWGNFKICNIGEHEMRVCGGARCRGRPEPLAVSCHIPYQPSLPCTPSCAPGSSPPQRLWSLRLERSLRDLRCCALNLRPQLRRPLWRLFLTRPLEELLPTDVSVGAVPPSETMSVFTGSPP